MRACQSFCLYYFLDLFQEAESNVSSISFYLCGAVEFVLVDLFELESVLVGHLHVLHLITLHSPASFPVLDN